MADAEASRTSTVRRGAQIVTLAAVLGLLALLIWKVVHDQRSEIPQQVAKGEHPAAPTFDLTRLVGDGTLSLASLRGKAVVVNFWASWCGPCRDEVPMLDAAWRRWRGRGLVVLGVDGSDDFTSDARKFMRKYGMTYPAVRDHRFSAVKDYGVTGYPETFFVNRKGRIVGTHVIGPVERTQLDDGIRAALQT